MPAIVIATCFFAAASALAADADTRVRDTDTGANGGPSAIVSISAEQAPFNFYDLTQTRVDRLTFLGGLELTSSDKRFGGLSGLRVSPDGQNLLAISDRGLWIAMGLSYKNGHLTGVKDALIAPMLNRRGKGVAEIRDEDGDSEAFTEIPGSGLVVAFEGDHRLWHYGATLQDAVQGKRPRPLPLPTDVAQQISNLPSNGGLEALTTLSDGSLFGLSERGADENGHLKGWIIGSDGGIVSVSYKARGGFMPTDMDTLPNGDVLLLERHLSLLGGLAARLSIISRADLVSGKPFRAREVARLQFPFNIDNMEGLAVRQDVRGRTIVYLVSDNNYNPIQRTILMMFRLEKNAVMPDTMREASLECRVCNLATEALKSPAQAPGASALAAQGGR